MERASTGAKEGQQVENSVMDEDQRNTGVMRSEEEEEKPQGGCEEVGPD